MSKDLFQGGLFAPEGVAFVQMPDRARKVWRVTALLIWWCITALVGALAVLVWMAVRLATHHSVWSPWMWTALGGVVLVASGGSAFTLSRLHRRWQVEGYYLDDDQIWLRWGLMHRQVVSIPYGRIQAVSASSGPLQRHYRLASLGLSRVTGESYSVDCLDEEDAAILREQMAALVQARGVEL